MQTLKINLICCGYNMRNLGIYILTNLLCGSNQKRERDRHVKEEREK